MSKNMNNHLNKKDYPTFKWSEQEGKNFFAKLWAWRKYRNALEKRKKEELNSFGEHLWSWTKTIVGAIIVVMILNGILIASFVVPTGSMENTVMTGDFLFVNKFIYGPSTPQVIPFLNIKLPFYKFPAFKDPQKGDVIVFIFPGNREEVKAQEFQYYLKRCVATAGDTLLIVNKRLYVNGIEYKLPENGKFENNFVESQYDKLRTFPMGLGFTTNNYGPIRIPKKGDIITLTAQNWRQWEVFIQREGHDFSFDGITAMVDNKPVKSYTIERDYCFGMGDNRDNSADSRLWGFIPYENIVGTPIIVYMSLPDRDENDRPYSLFERFIHIRWNRLAKLIH